MEDCGLLALVGEVVDVLPCGAAWRGFDVLGAPFGDAFAYASVDEVEEHDGVSLVAVFDRLYSAPDIVEVGDR